MKLTFVFILLSGATLQIVKSQDVSQTLEQTQITAQTDTKATAGYVESLGNSMYNSALSGFSWLRDEFYGTPNSMAPTVDSLKNKAASTSETVKSSMSSTTATIQSDLPDPLKNEAASTSETIKSAMSSASTTIKSDVPDSLNSAASQTAQSMRNTESYAADKMNSAEMSADNDLSKINAKLNS